MNEEIVIDLLSEQAIKLASLVWKKEPAEARDIIWHSLEAMETSQRITLSEFQAYLQRKARPKFFTNCPVCGAETPPAFTNCPACNVNLEIVRSNAIKEFALEFAKYGYIMGQQSVRPQPTQQPARKKGTIATVIGWAISCMLFLFAYGFIKDVFVMPLLYSISPTITPVPLRPTNKPKATTSPRQTRRKSTTNFAPSSPRSSSPPPPSKLN